MSQAGQGHGDQPHQPHQGLGPPLAVAVSVSASAAPSPAAAAAAAPLPATGTSTSGALTLTKPGPAVYPMDLAQKIVIKGAVSVPVPAPAVTVTVTTAATPTATTTAGQVQVQGQGSGSMQQLHQISIMRPLPANHQIITQAQIKHLNQPVGGGTVTGNVNPLLQGAHIISQGTQGGSSISNQGAVHALSASVRLLSPLGVPLQQHHSAAPVAASRPSSNPAGQTTAIAAKQIATGHHVPRGPAAGASLAVPRGSAAPRGSAPSTPGWPAMTGTQIRPGTVVYTPRQTRPHLLQVSTRPTLRPQVTQTAVVTRAVRPVSIQQSINTSTSQRTPSPQAIQATTTPLRATTAKVLPLVSRNYPQAKLVAALRPTISPRNVGGTYYYELSPSNVNNLNNQQAIGSIPASSTVTSTNIVSTSIAATAASNLPITSMHNVPINISNTSSIAALTSFTGTITGNINENRPPTSPQRPSILRKRDNEGSPMKSQCPQNISPLPSPGGSTTVSATSSPGPEEDDPIPPPSLPPQPLLQAAAALQFNNCSPRKKPRKQMLSSESRIGSHSGDCEFPSDGRMLSPQHITPPAPVPPEKPPKRATLDWRCGWRATALHFMRPTDVKRKDERRPSVVELAAQKWVLQKANGWKIHHLTAQMEDLGELEASIYKQMTDVLQLLESKPHQDLHKISELLKGNIQRSRIVGEGISEAKANVLKVFQHKPHVSDILTRQADKRCFKKHRNQC